MKKKPVRIDPIKSPESTPIPPGCSSAEPTPSLPGKPDSKTPPAPAPAPADPVLLAQANAGVRIVRRGVRTYLERIMKEFDGMAGEVGAGLIESCTDPIRVKGFLMAAGALYEAAKD